MPTVLSDRDRRKRDDRPDGAFYDEPRFVTHADDAFLARLTALYDSVTEPGDRVLDAMSSWVSHLPDTEYERVVGHGLNEAELAANDRLDEFVVRDLNADPSLPFDDGTFDVVCCALSVQYLQYPGPVFAAFARVLAPGGTVVVSFSNRMFPTKAVRAWRAASMGDRAGLVERYLDAGGFDVVDRIAERPGEDPFYAVVGTNP
ncbi:class I SAM-dependent methyltransferase [Halorubrum sp. GN11_10-6_MGM]|uniref:class I SAM-dependent methyltransferase n=1 Tax=Halorubrum sp. GN11_10-6_MGM TaxID=2518112 RepID=UPI0010F5BEC6|nr:methyltransferase domain-containing protein [Halorubrum sp. GN11_10-6_MGM]TKX74218.1 class I SAM-dependent methyltransferase [Halorubrum sp. GN11_10-6_MGM]